MKYLVAAVVVITPIINNPSLIDLFWWLRK